MEYIQTILFQIPSSRLEEAMGSGGLLAELDEHREFLRNQAGFRDLRISRSINSEGNILVVVETRWTDDGSLVRYETNDPNAATIVRKHQDVLVPNTLQVLDMEALRTESSFKPIEQAEHARERVVLPLAIPLGALAFLLLVIYGLSRIYLEIRGDNATALAAGIAIFVLLVALFLANNPKASGVQIGAILGICALILAGGTIWAVARTDDNTEAASEQPTASAAPGGASPGASPAGGSEIDLADNVIKFGGASDPTDVPAKVGENTFTVKNSGTAVHNIHVANLDGTFPADFCSPTDGASVGCTTPARLAGGGTGTLTFTASAAGTYKFRCDYHPTEMTGAFVVK
ncbi:MAG: plastocyanin/azurin family copper-binding protein [Chloroflexota bacterium]